MNAVVRRNYFVKRWILEALVSQPSPISALGTLDVIKTNRANSDTARKSPNLSSIKLAKVMMGMPEVNRMPGYNAAAPHVYCLKKRKRMELIA